MDSDNNLRIFILEKNINIVDFY